MYRRKPVIPLLAIDTPGRALFDQLADKWSLAILASLGGGAMRFNAIRRDLGGITQKSLTQSLRRLERNGLLARRVIATSPIAVEYEISPLGRALHDSFRALEKGLCDHLADVEKARALFDRRWNAL
ncbi:transcriptional regulator [Sphingopyxis lindanitolerans]|uniref:Transcriptional regulator n=1 Tax=Sphingopyxis lindanitolerans TaxID=2054227 RepID=A0A2S8B1M5_9SPHN|nr:transcriptional regulator [Sphingopyxis lindanitolerans]